MRNGSGRKAVDKTPAIIGPNMFPILTYDALSPKIEPCDFSSASLDKMVWISGRKKEFAALENSATKI